MGKIMKSMISSYLRKIKHLIYDLQILCRFKYPGMFYEYNSLLTLTEHIREYITGWKRDLIWCPSQLNKTMTYNGREYNLYARWRWDDPWAGYILYKNSKNDKLLWSNELLSEYNFKDYDIRKVERTMDKLFRDIYIHRTKSISYE